MRASFIIALMVFVTALEETLKVYEIFEIDYLLNFLEIGGSIRRFG